MIDSFFLAEFNLFQLSLAFSKLLSSIWHSRFALYMEQRVARYWQSRCQFNQAPLLLLEFQQSMFNTVTEQA
jgi:hypothetical protein